MKSQTFGGITQPEEYKLT
jgi:hypothetical protein